ncbi:hypothetical protein [Paenibacillus sp. UNC451MF]|uniref:hypothetical protein n=1 Tax=Paenibacillus sp. UNC451MF TaxID=1449063 RepID=UPI00068B7FC9|nr:hypothetical protein [Paenibacillus sp. UNC451MF]
MTNPLIMDNEWEVVFPLDGDILNEHDGWLQNGHLHVKVTIAAASNKLKLIVNGMRAIPENEGFYAEIVLDNYRNTISIKDEETGYSVCYNVYWIQSAVNKYRLSVDDNIWFLQDIAHNQLKYHSIFENPYLSIYKELHQEFGTKVHFNVYYQTDGFNLSQMPDKYKEEWKANSHWMRLTFHALQNEPDKPYWNADPSEVLRDCERVTEQIIRFAGEELLDPVTTIHWGEVTRESCRALLQFGFKGFAGYFRMAGGKPAVSYYLDNKETEHAGKRDFWKDHSEDLIFIKIDAVLDRLNVEDIIPSLEQLKESPSEAGFLEILIHEQYFYPHYKAYQADYRDKLFAAAKWAQGNGYVPAFLSECGLFDE